MWYITRRFIRISIWSWGPVVAAMLIMFIASAQPKYALPLDSEPVRVYFSGIMPVFPGLWEVLVKKSAHVIAYGILALLLMRGVLEWRLLLKRPIATGYAASLAVAGTVGYALIDEFHQSFVPGRHASGLDIGLDFIGAVVFVVLAHYAAQRGLSHRPAPIQAPHHVLE
jgi:VanZ family protein